MKTSEPCHRQNKGKHLSARAELCAAALRTAQRKKVRTPIDACIKWLDVQPEIFVKNYLLFGNFVVPLYCECGLNHNNVMN